MFFAPKRTASILDAPLLRLTPLDTFDVRHLVENISIIGQPGSGKTSGSGAHLAKAILLLGGSLLVLCAKPDERTLWEQYCRETGRTGSLVIFDGKRHRYNFIAAEIARLGVDAIGNVIELIMYIIAAVRSLGGNAQKGSEPFWDDMNRMILQHCLLIIFLATGTIAIASIIAFVRSAPRSAEEAKSREWQTQSFFFRCFAAAADKMDEATRAQMTSFWAVEWAGLDNKTRSNAAITLCAALDRFNHGWLKEAFTTDSTWTPEILFHGAVTVLDMPALTHMDDGILAQRLIKFVTERVLLARQSYGPCHAARPVVIWVDEAPLFVDSHDAKFMALCRSTLSGMVLMAQSIPSYYAVMGSDARDRVDQLLGNCTTKIWHSTSCPITAKIAADTLGQSLQRRANYSHGTGQSTNAGYNMGLGENWGANQSSGTSFSTSSGPQGSSSSSGSNASGGTSEGANANRGRTSGWGTNSNISQGWAEQMGYLMEPSQFGRILKTGGPAHRGIVTAVFYQSARRFTASGGPALLVEFVQ